MEQNIELVEEGALTNAKTNADLPALHNAVLSHEVETVVRLMKNGANVEEEDDSGRTPLHLACDMAESDLALPLLQKGVNVNMKDATGKTPLHYLVNTGGRARFAGRKIKIIDTLIELGVNANSQDQNGDTPLHLALRSIENQFVLQKLLNMGASVQVLNNKKETPYDVCLEKCKPGNFVWEATEHDSFNNRGVVISHILKMKLAGLPINIDIRDKTDHDFEFRAMKVDFVQEFKKIKSYKIGEGFPLSMIFSAFPNPHYLKNEVLRCQIMDDLKALRVSNFFPEYRFILWNTFLVSQQRQQLLPKVYKWFDIICVLACGKNMPDLAVEKILHYLPNEDLESLTRSREIPESTAS